MFCMLINAYYKALASFLNFDKSSSTLSTLAPPFLTLGASVFIISNADLRFKPKDSRVTSSTGFFLAYKFHIILYSITFIISGSLANLGVLSLKSQVITAGSLIERV